MSTTSSYTSLQCLGEPSMTHARSRRHHRSGKYRSTVSQDRAQDSRQPSRPSFGAQGSQVCANLLSFRARDTTRPRPQPTWMDAACPPSRTCTHQGVVGGAANSPLLTPMRQDGVLPWGTSRGRLHHNGWGANEMDSLPTTFASLAMVQYAKRACRNLILGL